MKKTNQQKPVQKKIILDLCGGTGSWSKPYKDAGYDVQVITLPDSDVTKFAFTGDGFLTFFNTKKDIKVSDIYGILAAPPCTEFSKAKTTSPRNFDKGLETIEACIKIVWEVQKHTVLKFWALENPEGLLSRFLGNPPYRFEQWWFGNDRCKPTHLWGRFKEPKRKFFEKSMFYEKAAHNKNSDWYSKSSAAERAITPAGFAKAFMEANK